MSQSIDESLKPAQLSERVVAFAIDAGLFGLLYLVSFWLLFPGYPIVEYKPAAYWHFPWIGAFLLYQAFFSAEGRVSVGKSMLGLRIVDAAGEPLPLDQALIRSATYLISCVGGLGFLWPVLNSARQAWHDLPVGSVVVRERGASASPVVKLAAAGCAAVLALAFYWEAGWGARYHELRDLADAQVGFAEISGRGFLRDMANLYDLDAGFEIKPDRGRYVVRAVAQDENRTPLKFVGS